MPKYDGTRMTKAIFGTGNTPPDVTPRTESGRILRSSIAYHVDPPRYIPGDLAYWDDDAVTQILAIEREAASKAVAEVLDRLERYSHRAERSIDGSMDASAFRKALALIASERKP